LLPTTANGANAETTADGANVTDASPPALDAVTTTSTADPTSDALKKYVAPVAPATFVQLDDNEQSCHR
jgi:hypothetical protein